MDICKIARAGNISLYIGLVIGFIGIFIGILPPFFGWNEVTWIGFAFIWIICGLLMVGLGGIGFIGGKGLMKIKKLKCCIHCKKSIPREEMICPLCNIKQEKNR
jgi:hypothetical protein